MSEAAAPRPAARPWYREPMMWLVATIPALTVFAGLSTVVIAHLKSDTVVADEYRKEGLAINRDPTRDRAAARLGVRAELRVVDDRLVVRLAPPVAPGSLVVLLSHATRADLDRLVALPRLADGSYAAPLAPLAAGHWHLEVSPADRAWRLTGEFVDTPGALALAPGPER